MTEPEAKRFTLAGVAMTRLVSGRQTGGLFCLFENASPGRTATPVHVHAGDDETVYVLEGQLTAILLLCTNLVGLSLGPSVVAAITQYGFGEPGALRYALAIVSAVAGPLSIVLLWTSARHFPGLIDSRRVAAVAA